MGEAVEEKTGGVDAELVFVGGDGGERDFGEGGDLVVVGDEGQVVGHPEAPGARTAHDLDGVVVGVDQCGAGARVPAGVDEVVVVGGRLGAAEGGPAAVGGGRGGVETEVVQGLGVTLGDERGGGAAVGEQGDAPVAEPREVADGVVGTLPVVRNDVFAGRVGIPGLAFDEDVGESRGGEVVEGGGREVVAPGGDDEEPGGACGGEFRDLFVVPGLRVVGESDDDAGSAFGGGCADPGDDPGVVVGGGGDEQAEGVAGLLRGGGGRGRGVGDGVGCGGGGQQGTAADPGDAALGFQVDQVAPDGGARDAEAGGEFGDLQDAGRFQLSDQEFVSLRDEHVGHGRLL